MHTKYVKPLLCSVLSLCLITRTRRRSTPAALCLGWGGTNTHHTLKINLTPMENAHAFGLPSPPNQSTTPRPLSLSFGHQPKLQNFVIQITHQYYLYSTSVDISSQRPLPTRPYFVKSRTPPTILFIFLSIFKSISILLSHTITINYSRSRRTKDTHQPQSSPQNKNKLRANLRLDIYIAHLHRLSLLSMKGRITLDGFIQRVNSQELRLNEPDSKSTGHHTPAHDPEALGGGGELVVEEEEGEADGATVPAGPYDA